MDNPETINEKIIARGLAAASLLQDQTFQDVIKELGVECFATFTESRPGHTQQRENAYYLYQGLQAIEHQLNAWVSAKDSAVDRLDAEHTAPDGEGPVIIKGNIDR